MGMSYRQSGEEDEGAAGLLGNPQKVLEYSEEEGPSCLESWQ